MTQDKVAVVAIGGNALSDGNSPIEEQMRRAYQAAELVKSLVLRDFRIVVVHGNGPQVGQVYLRQLSGIKDNLPPLNLAMCDALTQAEIGTMLELAIINTINRQMPEFEVLTIISQVEVRADDPAFQQPTKPVGPFYSRQEAREMEKRFPDWVIVEDAGRGYRRVVPSPRPVKVFATATIPDAFKTAHVVIAGGGGGIPVVRTPENAFRLVDAVIDKDRTSCLIALGIRASHFFLLTGVPHVSINYRQPNQQELYEVPLQQMKEYYRQGHFPPGSMGPKIEAAIEFAEKAGGEAIITNAENIMRALDREEGTRIHN